MVATSYQLGVPTRRVAALAETLGITRLSKSQVSEPTESLDGAVEQFRSRPLDAGPLPAAAYRSAAETDLLAFTAVPRQI